MSAVASLRIDTHEVHDLARALNSIPAEMRNTVIPRSLNDVGDGVFTLTKRNLAAITGAKPGRVAKALSKIKATPASHQVQVVANDAYMSLKDFGPRQGKKGVSAAPWKQRRVFPGTFLGPGGHVYRRIGKKRLPIEKLWGPAIPKEMVRQENAAPVMALVSDRLPKRVIYWTERAIAKAKR